MGVTVTESRAKINSPECSPCNGSAQVICHSMCKANSGGNNDNTLHWHLTTARGCRTKPSSLSVHSEIGLWEKLGPAVHVDQNDPPQQRKASTWLQKAPDSKLRMWSRTPGLSGHWPSAMFISPQSTAMFCTLYTCITSADRAQTWRRGVDVTYLHFGGKQHNSRVNKLFSFVGRSETDRDLTASESFHTVRSQPASTEPFSWTHGYISNWFQCWKMERGHHFGGNKEERFGDK